MTVREACVGCIVQDFFHGLDFMAFLSKYVLAPAFSFRQTSEATCMTLLFEFLKDRARITPFHELFK